MQLIPLKVKSHGKKRNPVKPYKAEYHERDDSLSTLQSAETMEVRTKEVKTNEPQRDILQDIKAAQM